ncbi:hypothetical protein N9C56_12195 [Paracoccaceae bacterium]|nr:hypothetical protein [Paracoccaceae bacterium]
MPFCGPTGTPLHGPLQRLLVTLVPSGSTQIINQPPDIRHCYKDRQAQFSRQFFAANQASVGRGQADFFSMGCTLC